MLEVDPVRAQKVAGRLDELNKKRQAVEESVLTEAEQMLTAAGEPDKVIVLAGDWHPGVIGIVAAKLIEKHYRPTILLSLEGEKAKGSARSIPGFHLYRALAECAPYLTKYGGHEYAAGLEIERRRLDDFKQAINAVAEAWLTEEMLVPTWKLKR